MVNINEGSGLHTNSIQNTTGNFTISWDHIPDADGYRLVETATPISGTASPIQRTYPEGENPFLPSQLDLEFNDHLHGFTYSYTLRVCNDSAINPDDPPVWCGESGYAPVSVEINEHIPNAPTGLIGPGTDYNQNFVLNWNTSVQHAAYYRVLRGSSVNGSYSEINQDYINSATISGAAWAPYGTNFYRVKACNSERVCGNPSSEFAQVEVEPPPNVLVAPVANEVGTNEGKILVQWSDATPDDHYVVQRRKDNGLWTDVPPGSDYDHYAKTLLLTNLTTGLHSFKVKGCNPELCNTTYSPVSNYVNLIVPPNDGALSANETPNNGEYTIIWDEVNGADSYQIIERVGLPSGPATSYPFGNGYIDGSQFSFGFDKRPVLGNQLYYYSLKACNDASINPEDPPYACEEVGYPQLLVEVNEPVPVAPSGFSSSPYHHEGDLQFTWNEDPSAFSYTLFEQVAGPNEDVELTWTSLDTGTGTIQLPQDGLHTYYLVACNSIGACNQSTPTSVFVVSLPDIPSNLRAPAVDTDADGIFTVQWDAASHVDRYELIQTDADNVTQTVYSDSDLEFTNSAPLSDGLYRYVVRGCIEVPDVCSADSNEIEVLVPDSPTQPEPSTDPDPSGPTPLFTQPDTSLFPDAGFEEPTITGGASGTNTVGAVKGSGGVSGGQASYSIAIVLPPGRNNMQPSVSLSYSSSGGNGVAGVGWNIGGGSAITRCPASLATDGYISDVQYDQQKDRLCLNGQRLVAPADDYNLSGTQYRTEIETFSLTTQYKLLNDPASNFEVKSKSGLISTYGTSANSRRKAGGKAATLSWLVDRQRDRSGNSIDYKYIDIGDGEVLLSKIFYTGDSQDVGDRWVSFEYEDRDDRYTVYQAGGKIRSTKRLKSIKTFYNGVGGSAQNPVREYSLNYTNSLSTGRSLLRNVKECAYEENGTQHCLPETVFSWQEKAPIMWIN